MSEQEAPENGPADPESEQPADIAADESERQSASDDEEWMEGCFHTFLVLFWMLCVLLSVVLTVYFVQYVYKELHWAVRVLIFIAGSAVGACFYGLAHLSGNVMNRAAQKEADAAAAKVMVSAWSLFQDQLHMIM